MLANENILNFDEVTKLPLYQCLTFLAYKQDYNKNLEDEYIELNNDRIDYNIGLIIGTRLGKKNNFGLFVEGNYNQMWERNWFNMYASCTRRFLKKRLKNLCVCKTLYIFILNQNSYR